MVGRKVVVRFLVLLVASLAIVLLGAVMESRVGQRASVDPKVFAQFQGARKGDIIRFAGGKTACVIVSGPPSWILEDDVDLMAKQVNFSCQPDGEIKSRKVGDILPDVREVLSPDNKRYPAWAAVYTATGRNDP